MVLPTVSPIGKPSAPIPIPAFESMEAAPPPAIHLPLAIEMPIRTVSESKRKENLEKIRTGFLHEDSEGRSTPGGACSEAFQELIAQSGDSSKWTDEDMKRPEIQDATLAYHTFALLSDRRSALIPEEQQLLNRLIVRQQKLNTDRSQTQSQIVNLANTTMYEAQARMISANQKELNELLQVLVEGVTTEAYHMAQGSGGIILSARSVWGTPVNMGAELTRSVWKLYDHSLKMTDKDRASMKFPNEFFTGSLKPKELAALLAIMEEMKRKAMQDRNQSKISQA